MLIVQIYRIYLVNVFRSTEIQHTTAVLWWIYLSEYVPGRDILLNAIEYASITNFAERIQEGIAGLHFLGVMEDMKEAAQLIAQNNGAIFL